MSSSDEINLDFDRAARIGLDEAIFARSKSFAQLDAIFRAARARSQSLLVTHLDAEKCEQLIRDWSQHLDYCPVSRTAFFARPGGVSRAALVPHRSRAASPAQARVAIVAAGTSDAGIAREAQRTLEFNDVTCACFMDVGVAGLWRLTERLDELREFPILIAVAGMDAALPTVLGGLVPGLIIAVPTSVGYGVATGGFTALNAILASCASGITVVNIDNGYGAACAALRALRLLSMNSTHATLTAGIADSLA